MFHAFACSIMFRHADPMPIKITCREHSFQGENLQSLSFWSLPDAETPVINGRSPGSNTWRYCTIFVGIFCGDIP